MTKRYVYPLLIGSTLMLSGCATLEIFSFGVSGLSYAVTGKSISDHALSTVMDQDCALHRAVIDEQVCIEPEPPGILRDSLGGSGQVVAANERYWQDLPQRTRQPAPQNRPLEAQSKPQVVLTTALAAEKPQTIEPDTPSSKASVRASPDEVVLALMSNRQQLQQAKSTRQPRSNTHAPQAHLVQPQLAHTMATASNVEVGVVALQSEFATLPIKPEPLLYAVLGSYNERHFAEQSLAEYGGLNAKVIDNPARANNKNSTLYRVVAGPFTEAQFNAKVDPNYQAWRIELCPQTLTLPPCAVQMLAQNKP